MTQLSNDDARHIIDSLGVAPTTTFKQLPVGSYFRFRETGSLLTKTSEWRYAARGWGQLDLRVHDRDQPVIKAEVPE